MPRSHPTAGLSGGDNMVVFTTARYAGRPLVITGPGAGAEVTAMGPGCILRVAAEQAGPVVDEVRAFGPATVANLGAGFDVLGAAVASMGDAVTARRRPQAGVGPISTIQPLPCQAIPRRMWLVCCSMSFVGPAPTSG